MHTFLNGRLIVEQGDITRLKVDAIVNAANSSLMGGGGVDGAIHRAGGPEILKQCKELRSTQYPDGLPTGKAVITGAGRLPCSKVIHTVGPVWKGGNSGEKEALKEAYKNSLLLASENGLRSVAFPAISTGIYGFPRELAAPIVYSTLKEHFEQHNLPETVQLVFFSQSDLSVFLKQIH
ncbi:MAG: O-acetyl-ADP-ribose deacetylase [Spirochaetota bacterium]